MEELISRNVLRTASIEATDVDPGRIEEGLALNYSYFVGGGLVRNKIELPAWGGWAFDASLLLLGEFNLDAGPHPKAFSLEE